MERAVIDRSGYRIPAALLTTAERARIRAELVVQPIVDDAYAKPAPVKVWKEVGGDVCLPPRFGVSALGPAPTDFTVTPAPLAFHGQLDPELRQDEVVLTAVDHLKKDGRAILSQHTGAGKTVCALATAAELGVKTLVVVHTKVLMDQWVERIGTFLPAAKVGTLVQDTVEWTGRDIVVGMLQSIAQREYGLVYDHGLVIFDECHHLAAPWFSQLAFKIHAPYMLGLSATPHRADGLTRVLTLVLGDVAFEMHRSGQGHVRVWTVRTRRTHRTVRRGDRLDMAAFVAEICGDQERNQLIIRVMTQLFQEGRCILFLTDRRVHAEAIHAAFPGESRLFIGGQSRKQQREPIKERIVCSTYSLCKEGLDVNYLDCLLMGTPKRDVNQITGRILRAHHKQQFTPLIVDLLDEDGVCRSQYDERTRWYRKCGFST